MKIFFIEKFTVELIVENGNPTGGASVQTLVWIIALKELGHEIYLAKLIEDTRKIKEEYSWLNLVPIYDSNRFKKKMVWYTYRLPKIFNALKIIKPAIVYTSMPHWTSFHLGIICKLLGVKHVIRTANDKNINFNLDKSINFKRKNFIKLSYAISDLILAQSEYQYQLLKEKYPNKKILKISNPIIIQKKYLQERIIMGDYIAWVANFRFQKNLRLLHEIASILPSEKFKIAGDALTSLDSESKQYLKKLQELRNVEFCGSIPQEKILDFLAKSKFLLSTSRFEGFSNTFLEAMMTGLPILSPRIINPDGIIDKYNLGILYEDALDLKLKLQAIEISNYSQKSLNCIKYLVENHNHLKLAKALMNEIKRLD